MALTINNFWGAETAGLEEAYASGSTSATAGAARSGGYGYNMDAAYAYLVVSPFEAVADAGGDYIFGIAFFLAANSVFDIQARNAAQETQIYVSAGGNDIAIVESSLNIVATYTDVYSDSTWHFLELYFQHSATGSAVLYLDGTELGSETGDFITTGSIVDLAIQHGNSTNACYVDDIYFMSGASGATDMLGECEIFSYRSSTNSATGDFGSALTSGTWLAAQTLPFSASVGATYDDGPISGGIYTDDVGGDGTGGPNTDSAITNQIMAIKGIWRMGRGNGGGTAHYGLLGNNTDGTTQSADFDPATSPANYFMVSEAASVVPTASEYCALGFSMDGGQSFDCYDMLTTILHVPSTVTPVSLPPVSTRRYAQRIMLNR